MADIGGAFVGAGYWGPNLARNFLASADAELRWVCDLDPARATRGAGPQGTVRTTTSLEEVLDDPDVHGVARANTSATAPGSTPCAGAAPDPAPNALVAAAPAAATISGDYGIDAACAAATDWL